MSLAPHDVLGVSPNAGEKEIRAAYRKLAFEHHPDRHSNEATKAHALERFKEINGAQAELLKQVEARKSKTGMFTCPGCGRVGPVAALRCVFCGCSVNNDAVSSKKPPDARECPNCKRFIPKAAKYCVSCGAQVSDGAGKRAPTRHPKPKDSRNSATEVDGQKPHSAVRRWRMDLLKSDGSCGGTFESSLPVTVVGRECGGVFANDSYLSVGHASFTLRGSQLFVQDEHSANGTFMMLEPGMRAWLKNGQRFQIGREVFRFDNLPEASNSENQFAGAGASVGRITHISGICSAGSAYAVPRTGLQLGRERGNVMFPGDVCVSALHCCLQVEDGLVYLADLGSSNGTFVQLTEEVAVHNGAVLLLGVQRYKVHLY